MTKCIPRSLVRRLTPAQRDDADRWWRALDAGERRDLVRLADRARTGVRLLLQGRFADPEDARDDAMWRREFIEYLDARPEIHFFLEEQRFHVCRAHPEARRVIERGRIAHDFACPLRSAGCPFARALALAPGRDVLLSLARRACAEGAPVRAESLAGAGGVGHHRAARCASI